MKLTDTAYFQPIEYFVADRQQQFKIVKDNNKGRAFPYKLTLGETLNRVSFDDCDIVIHQGKLDKLIKCTDFTYLRFSKSTNRFYEAEQCYFYADAGIFITITQDLSNEYDIELFEKDFYKVDYLFYDGTQTNIKQQVEQFFADYLQKYMLGEKIAILVKESDYFELKTHKIKPLPLDLDTMYNDNFVPVHTHIQKSLASTSKGVVMLHGIAGTGKTNYIKWLITQVPDKKFIFVPTTIIHQLTDPAFLGILLQNKSSVLVLEDCENYIAERSHDNKNTDVVASILNLADGLLSDVVECQIICTFNANIDKIDTALLRKGRLIAEYCFKALTIDKANAYLAATSNPDELSADSQQTVQAPITLAELTHGKQADFRESIPKKQFGFIPT